MTLILSASDFLYENNGLLLPTLSGTARLHADIDSAAKGYNSGSLPSSSYCREYALPDGHTGNYSVIMISGSVEGGAYSGSLGDNAVSVRAWVRLGTGTPYVAIFVKFRDVGLTNSVDTNSYCLRYQGPFNTLAFFDNAGATSLSKAGITFNEWHRIRLDYIPIASMKDVISVYTSSAGGTNTETWELVHTEEILNTDPSYITASTPTNMGLTARGFSDTGQIWFDDFDVYVTPVG